MDICAYIHIKFAKTKEKTKYGIPIKKKTRQEKDKDSKKKSGRPRIDDKKILNGIFYPIIIDSSLI